MSVIFSCNDMLSVAVSYKVDSKLLSQNSIFNYGILHMGKAVYFVVFYFMTQFPGNRWGTCTAKAHFLLQHALKIHSLEANK